MDSAWLGTPCGKGHMDAYSSFIGGNFVWLRKPKGDASGVKCPRCGKDDTTMALAQLYVPLDSFDRVLYVAYCKQCTKENAPFVFALRSQNFIGTGQEEAAKPAEKPAETALFVEDDDWGDSGDDDVEVSQTKENRVLQDDTPHVDERQESVDHEHAGDLLTETLAASRCSSFPPQLLDVFPEPEEIDDYGTLEEQLMEAEAKCPGTGEIDMTGEEEDDETPEQQVEREFMDKLALEPRQCVRWQPGGLPLLPRAQGLTISDCPHCGAPRHFECQLMAPMIYFLTKHLGESKNDLVFSTVLLFTCSANCYSQSQPYSLEEILVESEV